MLSSRLSDSVVVCYVGADRSISSRLQDALEGQHSRFDVQTVPDPATVLERLETTPIDCIVSQSRFESTDGLALLELVRDVETTLPFFLVDDGRVDDDSEVSVDRALSAGLTDYVRITDDERWVPIMANRIETAVSASRQELELERYRLMVETVPDGVYVLDDEFEYQFVNQSMADLLGYQRAELEGYHISLINDEEAVKRAETARERALSRDDGIEIVYNDHVSATGERIPCEVQFRAVTADGEFQGTVGVLRDITDRIEDEQELERQNERLQRFASIVSHDLRNPLTVALGNLDLLMDPETDTGESALEDVDHALWRMHDLIDDLLTLARQGHTIDEVEPIDLAVILDQALVTTETNGATVEVGAVDDVALEGDPSRVQEILENLVRNAMEHTHTHDQRPPRLMDAVERHSRQSVADSDAGLTPRTTDTPVTIRIGSLETNAGFYVEDDGPGIPERDRERVFEPGYTTNEAGTGFGLSIVEEIVDAHGWAIQVTDGAAGGARFEISTDGVSSDSR